VGKEKTGVGPVSYATVASLKLIGTKYSITPLTPKLVIQNANYPDQLDPSDKFVEKTKKLTCTEIISYRINYNSVMASRTSNQTYSKDLDTGTYCK